MKILDLFSGKGGELRKKTLESLGHEYVTVELSPDFDATVHADVMDLRGFNFTGFALIWASVPCQAFSVASSGFHIRRDGNEYILKTEYAKKSVALVTHVINFIHNANPKNWIIENPRGMLRKLPVMRGIRRYEVSYCQYGNDNMKPSDLWGSVANWQPRPMCHAGDTCHASAPGCTQSGTLSVKGAADRSIVPLDLWLEILSSIEGQIHARTQPTLL